MAPKLREYESVDLKNTKMGAKIGDIYSLFVNYLW